MSRLEEGGKWVQLFNMQVGYSLAHTDVCTLRFPLLVLVMYATYFLDRLQFVQPGPLHIQRIRPFYFVR